MSRTVVVVLVAAVALLLPQLWDFENVLAEPEPSAASPRKSKRVLVIGAGPSGLAALKEMLHHGHDAFAIEKASAIGGVFSLESAVTYDGLYLTTSNFFTAYSDFPPRDDAVRYWRAREYSEYLVRYAQHFGLMSKIRLNTEIKHAKLNEEEKWQVTLQGGDGSSEVFVDAIIMASGTNQDPVLPEFPGFTGEVIHSHQYNNSLPFANKRVLAIGTGESGSDVANLVAQVAKSVTVWARRTPMVAPRFLNVGDALESDLLNRTDLKPMNFLETGTSSFAALGMSHVSNALLKWRVLWAIKGKMPDHRRVETDWMNMIVEEHPELYWQAEHIAAPTKNFRLAELAFSGAANIVVAPSARFNGTTVALSGITYANGSRTEAHDQTIEIDTIIASCGFKMNMRWLEADIQPNPRTWFKHSFPPKYGDKFFAVGFARPEQGSLVPMSELVARYGAMVLSGERQLPEDYGTRAIEEGRAEDEHFALNPWLKSLVEIGGFSEAVSDLIGCRPRVPSILNFQHWLQFHLHARYPAWLRTRGPDARPEVMREIAEKLPFELQGNAMRSAFYLTLYFAQKPINIVYYLAKQVMGSSEGVPAPGHLFGEPIVNTLHGNALKAQSLFR